MKVALDHDSPVPLYHQIVEAIRYQIATGRLLPGDSLPSVRAAAGEFGVNLHTVRRAYSELAGQGLVEVDGPRGTRVAAAGPGNHGGAYSHDIDRFLEQTVLEARKTHGLSQRELAALLMTWTPVAPRGSDTVYVVECSMRQASAHAAEISAVWNVDARPWPLQDEAPPAGAAVTATYFHYNDIRRRWPDRLSEIRFVAIHPDPALLRRVTEKVDHGPVTKMKLFEFDEAKLRNIAADLTVLFPPPEFVIEPVVIERPPKVAAAGSRNVHQLFTPRVWADLPDRVRQKPLSFQVPYVIQKEDIEGLGEHYGWRPRRLP